MFGRKKENNVSGIRSDSSDISSERLPQEFTTLSTWVSSYRFDVYAPMSPSAMSAAMASVPDIRLQKPATIVADITTQKRQPSM